MNREIETQVIAHLIDEPQSYSVNSSRLSEMLFTEADLREIYLNFVRVFKAGSTPDAANISGSDEMRVSVLRVVSEINYDLNLDGWIRILTDKWKERRLGEIILKATYQNSDINASIENLQRELASLIEVDVKEPKQIRDHVIDVFQYIDRNQQQKGLTGIPTGLYMLNMFTGGWQGGDLVVIAGDTSQGKTSLALQFARTAGLEGVPSAIFSYEMSARQLTARLMSQESGISSKDMLTGKISQDKIATIQKSVAKLIGTPIYIDECRLTRLDYLINSMMALFMTRGVKLFVIDYLQLLSNNMKGGNKEQEIAGIARELKNFAKKTDTTVLLLSQLNRGQNKRPGSEPKLSDLRDSGQIEEAADIVLFAYRPEVYGIQTMDDGTPSEGLADLIIAKGRSIGLGRFTVNFNKELTLFSNFRND